MNLPYSIPTLPLSIDLETKPILKQLNRANKKLAELKGIAQTIPNEDILINTLVLQEAKDSSAVENIVTTHDDLYRADLDFQQIITNASAKEVLNYRQAMKTGFALVREKKILSNNFIIQIQQELEGNRAGFRSVPGTTLKNQNNEIVYTPPQNRNDIEKYMDNLESYINDPSVSDIDPLIKMAVIHHQFESIHPFYDGNGRTGRIICILYLIINDLLDLPILYLSRFITHNKAQYYSLLQKIRTSTGDTAGAWENWVLFILNGVEETAEETIRLVKGISVLMNEYKQTLRPLFGKQYKHELLNNLFFHPYTKIEFVARDMMVKRQAASKYIKMICEQTGLLSAIKVGRSNYYINTKLVDLFINHASPEKTPFVEAIESISEHRLT